MPAHAGSKYRLVRADGKHIVVGTQASLFRAGLTPEEIKVLWFGKTFCLQNKKYPNHVSFMRATKKVNDTIRGIAREEGVPRCVRQVLDGLRTS